MKPIYDIDGITLYHGDCGEILPQLQAMRWDAVITDPPYPDYHVERYGYIEGALEFLRAIECRQLIFWSAKVDFPLDYTAIHIWDKCKGAGSGYERIFERNSNMNWRVYREGSIINSVTASMGRDIVTGHPSQKPIRLMKKLLSEYTSDGGMILDPYAGSGSTLVAAKRLGRRAIGIEIDERYCQMIIQRLGQTEMVFGASVPATTSTNCT